MAALLDEAHARRGRGARGPALGVPRARRGSRDAARTLPRLPALPAARGRVLVAPSDCDLCIEGTRVDSARPRRFAHRGGSARRRRRDRRRRCLCGGATEGRGESAVRPRRHARRLRRARCARGCAARLRWSPRRSRPGGCADDPRRAGGRGALGLHDRRLGDLPRRSRRGRAHRAHQRGALRAGKRTAFARLASPRVRSVGAPRARRGRCLSLPPANARRLRRGGGRRGRTPEPRDPPLPTLLHRGLCRPRGARIAPAVRALSRARRVTGVVSRRASTRVRRAIGVLARRVDRGLPRHIRVRAGGGALAGGDGRGEVASLRGQRRLRAHRLRPPDRQRLPVADDQGDEARRAQPARGRDRRRDGHRSDHLPERRLLRRELGREAARRSRAPPRIRIGRPPGHRHRSRVGRGHADGSQRRAARRDRPDRHRLSGHDAQATARRRRPSCVRARRRGRRCSESARHARRGNVRLGQRGGPNRP